MIDRRFDFDQRRAKSVNVQLSEELESAFISCPCLHRLFLIIFIVKKTPTTTTTSPLQFTLVRADE